MKLEILPDILEHSYDYDALVYWTDNKFFYNSEFPQDVLQDIRNKTLQVYTTYYLYEEDWKSPRLYLIGRGKISGKFKICTQNFLPYCYETDINGDYKTYLGKSVEKLIFKTRPKRVADYRKYCKRKKLSIPYEADVLFHRRFMCDTYDYFQPKEPIQPRVAIFDVETEWPKSDDMIAFAINDAEKDYIYYNCHFDEQNVYCLALDLLNHLDRYDIVAGWNVNFDVRALEYHLKDLSYIMIPALAGWVGITKEEYLNELKVRRILTIEKRNKAFDALVEYGYLELKDGIISNPKQLDYQLEHHFAIVDLLEYAKKMLGKEIKGRWTLQNAGRRIVGMYKHETGSKHIYDLEYNELLEYNVTDTLIPEVIDYNLGGIDGHVILAWSLQMPIDDVRIVAAVNDISLLRAYHKANKILPSRPHNDDKSNDARYDAAKPEAREGIYKELIELDLESAYPTTVIAINASSESKDPDGDISVYNENTGVTVKFNSKINSVFIETLKHLMEERRKVKRRMKLQENGSFKWKQLKSIDFALKTQAAAFSHGIFGWTDSRMNDIPVADAITAVVRNLIQSIKDKCDEIEYPWVYSHTDSVIINASKEKKNEILKILNDYIEEYTKEKEYSVKPNLEYKSYYDIGYIHSPARNVLIADKKDIDNVESWDESPNKVTGMNFMRSEVPEALVDVEIDLIRHKMKGASTLELIDILKIHIDNMRGMDSIKLGLIKPLTKPISRYGKKLLNGSYGNVPYHIKALIRANAEYRFMVKKGEKFMILPIMTDETVGVRVIRRKKIIMAFPTDTGLPEKYKIDYENYLKDNLYGKVNKLFGMKPMDLEKELDLKW